jgi:hypothetical protein
MKSTARAAHQAAPLVPGRTKLAREFLSPWTVFYAADDFARWIGKGVRR